MNKHLFSGLIDRLLAGTSRRAASVALLLVIGGATLLVPSTGTAQVQLLLNGSFELPAVSGDGNHIGTAPDNWNSEVGASGFNLIRSTGPGTNPAEDGVQYLDLTGGATYTYQAFTLATPSQVTFGAWFSPRDGEVAKGGNASIYDAQNLNLLFDAPRVTNPNATFVWLLSSATTTVLPAGTYTFRAIVDDPANVDNAYVTTVPEPTALALVGLSTLGVAAWRRRR